MRIAVGSLYELQTQIEVAFQLHYWNKVHYDTIINLCTEIDKMFYNMDHPNPKVKKMVILFEE